MNSTKPNKIYSMAVALALVSVLMLLLSSTELVKAGQKSSDELLLEIMDLHGQLVTNEVFLAQAKMLGAYLEAARPMEETKKVRIYATVLQILNKIRKSPTPTSPQRSESQSESENKFIEGEQKGRSVYVPGAALLEIFKADSIETIPRLPVIRAYWERDLAYSGGFLLPDRYSEIGKNSRYVARFSFYYEAREPGDYGFTIMHGGQGRGILSGSRNPNACELTVGGIEITKVKPEEPSGQGVCNLRKGFHRIEFWLVSAIGNMYDPQRDIPADRYPYSDYYYANFEVKILPPKALDAMQLTKDMLLLKKE